jgi:hypothetical protein
VAAASAPAHVTPAAAAVAPAKPAAAAAAAPAAAAAAADSAPAPAALSAAVLGLVGKPALPSAPALLALEAALAVRSYVAAYTPTAEDEAVHAALVAGGAVDGSAALKSLPNVTRWFRHMASFTPAERAGWPLTLAQLNSGALNARQTTLFTVAGSR